MMCVISSCPVIVVLLCGMLGEQQSPKFIEKTVRQNGLLLTVTLPTKAIAGSAVNIKIRLENQSTDLVLYRHTGKYVDYNLATVDAKGKSVALTQFGKVVYGDARIIGGSGVVNKLQPGKYIESTVNVARVFDLSQDGVYTLGVTAIVKTRGDTIQLKVEKMMLAIEEEPR